MAGASLIVVERWILDYRPTEASPWTAHAESSRPITFVVPDERRFAVRHVFRLCSTRVVAGKKVLTAIIEDESKEAIMRIYANEMVDTDDLKIPAPPGSSGNVDDPPLAHDTHDIEGPDQEDEEQ